MATGRHTLEAPLLHLFQQAGNRKIGIHIIEVGGVSVVVLLTAEQSFGRGVGCDAVGVAHQQFIALVPVSAVWLTYGHITGGNQRRTAFCERLFESGEGHIIEVCPLVGLVVSLGQVIVPCSIDISDGFRHKISPSPMSTSPKPTPVGPSVPASYFRYTVFFTFISIIDAAMYVPLSLVRIRESHWPEAGVLS